ncbi:MAG: hypothetical protein ACLVCH_07525 [Roseburia inulinivorans]
MTLSEIILIVAFRLSVTYNHFQVKLPANMDASYYSVDGFGTAKIVEVPQEKSRH